MLREDWHRWQVQRASGERCTKGWVLWIARHRIRRRSLQRVDIYVGSWNPEASVQTVSRLVRRSLVCASGTHNRSPCLSQSENRNVREFKLRRGQAVHHEERPTEVCLRAKLQGDRRRQQAESEGGQRQEDRRHSNARNAKSEAQREALDTVGDAEWRADAHRGQLQSTTGHQEADSRRQEECQWGSGLLAIDSRKPRTAGSGSSSDVVG